MSLLGQLCDSNIIIPRLFHHHRPLLFWSRCRLWRSTATLAFAPYLFPGCSTYLLGSSLCYLPLSRVLPGSLVGKRHSSGYLVLAEFYFDGKGFGQFYWKRQLSLLAYRESPETLCSGCRRSSKKPRCESYEGIYKSRRDLRRGLRLTETLIELIDCILAIINLT